MKLEKLFVVSVVAALSVAVTGCRYNKSGAADDAASGNETVTVADNDNVTGTGVATESETPNDDTLVNDNVTADDGSIVTTIPFDQNPKYKPVEGADFMPVYFGFDSTTIPNKEISKIETVAKDLAANPTHVVIVAGNCDERGSNEYNLSLGENRAIMVQDYLARLGVNANRIQTKSYGEEKPAVAGAGEAVWSKNRRAEFELFETK